VVLKGGWESREGCLGGRFALLLGLFAQICFPWYLLNNKIIHPYIPLYPTLPHCGSITIFPSPFLLLNDRLWGCWRTAVKGTGWPIPHPSSQRARITVGLALMEPLLEIFRPYLSIYFICIKLPKITSFLLG
jgi:hypothetical protein